MATFLTSRKRFSSSHYSNCLFDGWTLTVLLKKAQTERKGQTMPGASNVNQPDRDHWPLQTTRMKFRVLLDLRKGSLHRRTPTSLRYTLPSRNLLKSRRTSAIRS